MNCKKDFTVLDQRETSKLEKKDMDRYFPGGKPFQIGSGHLDLNQHISGCETLGLVFH